MKKEKRAELIEREASRWLAREDRGFTESERSEFECWLAENEQHRQAWNEVNQTWEDLEEIPVREHLKQEADSLRIRRFATITWKPEYLWLCCGLAMLLVGLLAIRQTDSIEPAFRHPSVVYRSPDKSLIQLEDGSKIETRGASEIIADFSSEFRKVFLVKGEAYFEVESDPYRPFVVSVGSMQVRAVGTAFLVRQFMDGAEVAVTHGKVAVVAEANAEEVKETEEEVFLLQGQKASVFDGVLQTQELSTLDLEREMNWRHPILTFASTPFPDVIQAFEKHCQQTIRIGDACLSERRISGSFRADNLEGFLRLIQMTFNVRVETDVYGTVFLYSTQ